MSVTVSYDDQDMHLSEISRTGRLDGSGLLETSYANDSMFGGKTQVERRTDMVRVSADSCREQAPAPALDRFRRSSPRTTTSCLTVVGRCSTNGPGDQAATRGD